MTTKEIKKKITKPQVRIASQKEQFIEQYPEHGTIGATLTAIGVKSRHTFYDWCKADKKFTAVYDKELLPNRRDKLVSGIYRMATAEKSVALCPVCEGTGKYNDRSCHGCHGKGWIECHVDGVQLGAAQYFLKAIDAGHKERIDDLYFIDRQQISGDKENPLFIGLLEKLRGLDNAPEKS